MAGFNSLMPGESYGMPDGMGGLGGLGGMPSSVNNMLNNPALQLGLGILANNQGNYGSFGAAIGKGGLMGLSNLQRQQEALRQQKLMELRDKQFNQEYGMKQAEFDQKTAERNQQEAAHNEFDTKFPQYKGLSRLNPQAAMKIAYPEAMAKTADPYWTTVATDKGLMKFNARTGEFLPLTSSGQPLVKSTDSPELQGRIAGAKSYNENLYKPTDIIDGRVLPQSLAAVEGGAPPPSGYQPKPTQQPLPSYQGNLPYQPTWNGQPMGAPGTTATDMREGDGGIQLRLPSNHNSVIPPNVPRIGVKVPTKAEQEKAKADVEVAKDQALQTNKQVNGAQKGLDTLNDMYRYLYKDGKPLRDANGRLATPDEPTILGNGLIDRAAMKGHEFGVHNDKASNIIGARRLINKLVLDANNGSLGAGVSNADVEFLKSMQGIVSTAQDPKDVYNAIADNEQRFKDILSRAKGDSSIMPKNESMPSNSQAFESLPKPNQYKGKVIRDDVTGKRYQSNGLQWKEI